MSDLRLLVYYGLPPCPWCGRHPAVESRVIDIGCGDFAHVFSVRCETVLCPIQPGIYVRGESGYRQGDKLTNQEAEQAALNLWSIQQKSPDRC